VLANLSPTPYQAEQSGLVAGLAGAGSAPGMESAAQAFQRVWDNASFLPAC